MNRITSAFLLLLFTLLLYSCQTDYATLPTYSSTRQLQVVIETPAGSSLSVKYDSKTKTFANETLAGKDRVLQFLPYPGNYSFIPSTEVGPNGRGVSTLVLAERAESGTVMEVIPIATIMLEKPTGDLYPVIISVPARPSERTINLTFAMMELSPCGDYKGVNTSTIKPTIVIAKSSPP